MNTEVKPPKKGKRIRIPANFYIRRFRGERATVVAVEGQWITLRITGTGALAGTYVDLMEGDLE